MAIDYQNENIIFTKRVFENELEPLKAALDALKKPIIADLTACEEMHGAVVQLLLAYHAVHGCAFLFGSEPTIFKMAIEGFNAVENDCH